MIEVGDKVEVIDELVKGEVKSIVRNQICIKTEDGLEFFFEKEKVVKVTEGEITLNIPQSGTFLAEKEEKKRKKVASSSHKDKSVKIMEIDLHIEQLVENPRGMQNYEMLTKQLNVARYQLEFALMNNFQKVIFIHGVGEGVLKMELEYLLSRYEAISFYDADYSKYGQGATEVYIHQSRNKSIK
ncbi:MAG: Smr/MutS family protein [Capnocytophaga sp.]|nr:Smr/MutS family protein [Capnocytophaga sp.]